MPLNLQPALNKGIRESINEFDIDGARKALEFALKQKPDADTYYLASMLAKTEKEKLKYLEKALDKDPFHEEAFAEFEQMSNSTAKSSSSGLARRAQFRNPKQYASLSASEARWKFENPRILAKIMDLAKTSVGKLSLVAIVVALVFVSVMRGGSTVSKTSNSGADGSVTFSISGNKTNFTIVDRSNPTESISNVDVSISSEDGETSLYIEDPSGNYFPKFIPPSSVDFTDTQKNIALEPINSQGYIIKSEPVNFDISLPRNNYTETIKLRDINDYINRSSFEQMTFVIINNTSSPVSDDSDIELYSSPFDKVIYAKVVSHSSSMAIKLASPVRIVPVVAVIIGVVKVVGVAIHVVLIIEHLSGELVGAPEVYLPNLSYALEVPSWITTDNSTTVSIDACLSSWFELDASTNFRLENIASDTQSGCLLKFGAVYDENVIIFLSVAVRRLPYEIYDTQEFSRAVKDNISQYTQADFTEKRIEISEYTASQLTIQQEDPSFGLVYARQILVVRDGAGWLIGWTALGLEKDKLPEFLEKQGAEMDEVLDSFKFFNY
jgi:hypothetical protein